MTKFFSLFHGLIIPILPKQKKPFGLFYLSFYAMYLSAKIEDAYSTQFGGTTLRMPGFTSSPVSSHRNCSSLISSKSSVFRGHLNFPSSSLLYSNRNPSPSQTKALIRSFRLPQKRNSMSVSKGFRLNRSQTVAASPSISYLKSVYPQAM